MAAAATDTYSAAILEPIVMPEKAKLQARILAPGDYVKGTVLGSTTTLTTQNDVKTLTVTGTPTGGSFRLAFAGQVTAAIAYNAAVADVQAALEALSTIGAGNVVVTGAGALPGNAHTLTFGGSLAAREMPSITLYSNSLTGGTNPTAAVANTTPGRVVGGHLKPYNDSNTDGSNIATAICQMTGSVDTFGRHYFSGGGIGANGLADYTAPVWICGVFKTKELTGIDAAAVTDLGRIIQGAVGSLTHDATWLAVNVA